MFIVTFRYSKRGIHTSKILDTLEMLLHIAILSLAPLRKYYGLKPQMPVSRSKTARDLALCRENCP
jgi:hypothetical protein